MSETLAELAVRITADAKGLQTALASVDKDVAGAGGKLEKETKTWQEQFKAIGIVATAAGASITVAMTKMIMSFADTGSELNDLSLKTGVSVEALSGLKYAAEQNGASLGTVEMAIRRVASAMQDAESDTSASSKAFSKLGISLKSLQGLKPEAQFLRIAGAIADIPDPMTKSAIAVDLFGRSGTDMLPMLSEGAAGLKKMMDAGVKLSGWTTAGAKSADALGDSFDTLKTSMSGVVNAVGASLAPMLQSISDMLVEITGGVMDWVKANPELSKALSTAAIAIGVFATGVGLASLAVKYLGTTVNLYFGGVLLAIGAAVAGITLLISWLGQAGGASKKLSDEQVAATEAQKQVDKDYFAAKRAGVERTTQTVIEGIRKEYGAAHDLSKSLIDMAYATRDANINAIRDEERVAELAHDNAISRANDEYRASLSKEERALQDQIDAIDKQTSAEDLALTRAEEQKRLATLTGTAHTEYAAQIARNELLRTREAEKDALRSKIQALRDETGSVVAELQKQRDAKIAAATASLTVTLNNIITEKAAEEQKLVEDVARLIKERDAKIASENDKLEAAKTRIKQEEFELESHREGELLKTIEFVNRLNAENAKVRNVEYTVFRREVTISGGGTAPSEGQNPPHNTSPITGYATGGIIPGAIGSPQLAIVHGGETVIPANESGQGNITLNISGPLFMEREDQMNNFVDKIRKGIQRSDRLRFGGAWDGR